MKRKYLHQWRSFKKCTYVAVAHYIYFYGLMATFINFLAIKVRRNIQIDIWYSLTLKENLPVMLGKIFVTVLGTKSQIEQNS